MVFDSPLFFSMRYFVATRVAPRAPAKSPDITGSETATGKAITASSRSLTKGKGLAATDNAALARKKCWRGPILPSAVAPALSETIQMASRCAPRRRTEGGRATRPESARHATRAKYNEVRAVLFCLTLGVSCV